MNYEIKSTNYAFCLSYKTQVCLYSYIDISVTKFFTSLYEVRSFCASNTNLRLRLSETNLTPTVFTK